MELNQAVKRVLGRHLFLVSICTIVGLAIGFLFSARAVPTYSAETRLVLDTQDPTGLDEAQTIADTARAIVTSPSEVRVALRYAGATRNPLSVASNDIAVRALGSSGVLQLTVTDRDPRIAAVVANKLSDDLIRTRLAVSQGGYEHLRSTLESQIQELTTSLEKTVRNVRSAPVAQPRAVARETVLQRQLSVAQTSLSNLEAEQAQKPKPDIIDRAEAPIDPNPSRWAKDTALGGLAGLLIGLALAALLETLRPSIVGAAALARELGAPSLGELPSRNDVPPVVAETARLAAISADVRLIQLVAADPSRDLTGLADALQTGLQHALEERTRSRVSPAPPKFRSFSAVPTKAADVRATGLVAVLPSTIAKAGLQPLESLLEITGYELIGIIIYRSRRWWRGGSGAPPLSTPASRIDHTARDESAPPEGEAAADLDANGDGRADAGVSSDANGDGSTDPAPLAASG